MRTRPRPANDISGTFCTWAVSLAVNQGGIPENEVWFNSNQSLPWLRTQDNFEFWTDTMGYGYYESSEIPGDYENPDPQDPSRRVSIHDYEPLHQEVSSILWRIQIGDLVYYMDPTNQSNSGVPEYTHVAMVTDLVYENGTITSYIWEMDGPVNGYGGDQISLPRSIYDTNKVHIMKIAIVFMGRG